MDNVKIGIEPLRILGRDLEFKELLGPLAKDNRKIIPAALIGGAFMLLIGGLTIAASGMTGVIEPSAADTLSTVILALAFFLGIAGAHLLDCSE